MWLPREFKKYLKKVSRNQIKKNENSFKREIIFAFYTTMSVHYPFAYFLFLFFCSESSSENNSISYRTQKAFLKLVTSYPRIERCQVANSDCWDITKFAILYLNRLFFSYISRKT